VICDVVFDLPLRRAFSYAVRPGLKLARGQRVRAALQGRARVGIVVALREGDEHGLKPVDGAVEPVPILSAATLELCRWAAAESLSSWGSTMLSLLPPPPRARAAEPVAPAPEPQPASPTAPELWTGASREARLIEELESSQDATLLIAPDRDTAGRWAERLDAARLDSGASASARRAAWFAASRGRARIVAGTRSALLVPLPPPAKLVLLDEHDPAHKPPGPPRLHSRDLLLRRAALEGNRLLLLSATPSAETWWRAQSGHVARRDGGAAAWPAVVSADTRGILRHHPVTPVLGRAIADAARAGRRTVLIVMRAASALACDDCGVLLRCPDCAVPLARAPGALRCRLCGRSEPLPTRCPGCGGHHLSLFGWDAERVEAAVHRRFPRLTISRKDRGAQVLIGPATVLKGRASGSLGCVGVIALDALLRVPDFRASERALELLWAAAEAVGAAGRVVVQTLHPEHEAIRAARDQDLAGFFEHELKLRLELGYPPFRRLCLVSARSRSAPEAQALLEECGAALRGIPGLIVYPPAPLSGAGTHAGRWRFLIKGPEELPRLISQPLGPFVERRRRLGGMVEVEMDPLE